MPPHIFLVAFIVHFLVLSIHNAAPWYSPLCLQLPHFSIILLLRRLVRVVICCDMLVNLSLLRVAVDLLKGLRR